LAGDALTARFDARWAAASSEVAIRRANAVNRERVTLIRCTRAHIELSRNCINASDVLAVGQLQPE